MYDDDRPQQSEVGRSVGRSVGPRTVRAALPGRPPTGNYCRRRARAAAAADWTRSQAAAAAAAYNLQ